MYRKTLTAIAIFSITTVALLDHLVGELLKMPRHVQAKRLGRLEVDHELEFGWLLDWEIAWLAPRKIRSTYVAACRN
jgi:hypothetical protein